MPFETELISNKGGRKSNQDCCGYLTLEDGACWVLADGLGGHRGGEIASRIAVDTILASFRQNRELSPKALESHLLAAHNEISRQQQSDPGLSNMRTTVVVLLSDYDWFLSGYVGDSRLYYFQGGSIRYQTRDHSVPQVMVDAGEITPAQIRGHVDRNRLLRSLGMDGDLKPAVCGDKQRLYNQDAFLLCVDGFWEYVSETEMEADLARSAEPGSWLSVMESRIRRRAEEDHDNYTAIAISFAGDPAIVPPPVDVNPSIQVNGNRATTGDVPRTLRQQRQHGRKKFLAALGIAIVLVAGILLVLGFAGDYVLHPTTTLNNSMVAKMKISGSWTEVTPGSNHTGKKSENQEFVRLEYRLAKDKDVKLVFIRRAVDPASSEPAPDIQGKTPGQNAITPSKSKGANHPASVADPSAPAQPAPAHSKDPSQRAMDSSGVLAPFGDLDQDIGCEGGSSLREFGTEILGASPAYRAEIDCPQTGIRAYATVAEQAGKRPSTVQEIILLAPASKYERYVGDLKAALATIEWR